MDKKQRFAIETLIPKLLGDALYQIICYYLKKDIAEMRESVKIDSIVATDIESQMKIRAHVFHEMMKTDKFRDMLLHSLKKITKNKTDIIAALLVQYELAKGDNSTLMHDSLTGEFETTAVFLKHCIKDKNYEPIYQKSQAASPTVQ